MTAPIVEGFSISHAAILDSVTGLDTLPFGDIYGVREGSLTIQEGNYDNTGDDQVLSSWFWFDYATVTVKSGYVPFQTISLITGAAVTSSGASPNDTFSLPIWNKKSLNTLTRPMLIRVPSKDSVGGLRQLDFILYKVQFSPMKFEGPTYRGGLLLDYTGRALISPTDETNAVLTDPAVGRMISRPSP